MKTCHQRTEGFTIVEIAVTVIIISIVAGISVLGYTFVQKGARDTERNNKTTLIADSLEKYYQKNGEYPSVASIANQPVDQVKQKLGISDGDVLVFPDSSLSGNTSIVSSGPALNTLLYLADTTDSGQSSQCQTSLTGFCDKFTLKYIKEVDGATVTIESLKK